MQNSRDNQPRYWVGKTDDETLVFDRDIQFDGSEYVFLWDVTEKYMRTFAAKDIRKFVVTVRDMNLLSIAISGYETWFAENGNELLEQKRKNTEERKEKQHEREELHRKFLSVHGKIYHGTRVPERGRPHRETRCWACKNDLDNFVDVECNACGGILCQCGACLCVRSTS